MLTNKMTVSMVILLIVFNIFTTVEARRNRDYEESLPNKMEQRLSNKLDRLNNKLDRLDKKIDTVVEKLDINVDWPEDFDAKWPPLVLLNASIENIERGKSFKLWYITYNGQCNDTQAIWENDDFDNNFPSGIEENRCSCNSSFCLGFTSLILNRTNSLLPKLLLRDKKNLFFYTVIFKDDPKNRVDKEITCDRLFYVKSPKEIVYQTGDEAIVNVVYSNKKKSDDGRHITIRLQRIDQNGLIPYRMNIYRDTSKVRVVNEINYLHHSTFDIHINTTLVNPLGLAQFNGMCMYHSDGPIDYIAVKQEVPIHAISQQQAYPENYLDWDTYNRPCDMTIGTGFCFVRCEVQGNNIHNLVLRQFQTNGLYRDMLPKQLLESKYYAKGVWFIEKPETIYPTLNLSCVVVHEDETIASSDISIPLYIPPRIQINDSYVDYDADNKTLKAVCLATGYPKPDLNLILDKYIFHSHSYRYEYCETVIISPPLLKIEFVAEQVVGTFEDFDFNSVCKGYDIIGITVNCEAKDNSLSDNDRIGEITIFPEEN